MLLVNSNYCMNRDNELRLSILVRNENELLYCLSADNVILLVYIIKFIFICFILFGLDWFGSVLVLDRFNFEFRVEISSTFSHVGSSLVSGRSVQVAFVRSRCTVSLINHALFP